ncbi:hypothetical protein AUEXF2481DRAFT_632902 [Aureobasidium subglaciale EXF-2481]|uniref:Uncharacterized protein n=1 Tax=Aureobasidium subglaciale (strain EXF-2481) TaxID=1043005 RepID=A0A074ZC66_AURSE|nr:uncharacterized protein AUEXF2481DRAFT_632902 [Aureobasidium subglaciale EXF-2481]KEQ96321.1 hypothetical protein AUEXF2481DRAFT_632902 [Aureobasidium subglaciale EXF-2481]
MLTFAAISLFLSVSAGAVITDIQRPPSQDISVPTPGHINQTRFTSNDMNDITYRLNHNTVKSLLRDASYVLRSAGIRTRESYIWLHRQAKSTLRILARRKKHGEIAPPQAQDIHV